MLTNWGTISNSIKKNKFILTNEVKEFEKEFNENPLTKHVILLYELNKTKYSKDIIKHLAELNVEKGSEVLAAKLDTNVGRYDYSIQVSKKASYEKRFYNKFNYPIINTPRVLKGKSMPSQEIILAITRQKVSLIQKQIVMQVQKV